MAFLVAAAIIILSPCGADPSTTDGQQLNSLANHDGGTPSPSESRCLSVSSESYFIFLSLTKAVVVLTPLTCTSFSSNGLSRQTARPDISAGSICLLETH